MLDYSEGARAKLIMFCVAMQAYIQDAPEVLTPTAVLVERAGEELITAAIADGAVEPTTPAAFVEVEQMGEAAAAAKGQCAVLRPLSTDGAFTDVSNDPAVAGGRRHYVTAESLLCALCKPGGACLPGCPACEELAGASGRDMPSQPMVARGQQQEEEQEYDVISTDGWHSPVSVCSTPGRGTRCGLEAFGAGGDVAYDSEEEECEAASADVFQSVDASLQQAARDVFHRRLARLSGTLDGYQTF
jgi:hypothetical protein